MGCTTKDFEFAVKPKKTPKNFEQFKRIVENYDAHAMADYIKENHTSLLGFARGLCKDTQVADEVLQESYRIVLETQHKKASGTGDSFCKEYPFFDTWVHSIIKTTLLRQHHKDSRRAQIQHYDTASDFPEGVTGIGQNSVIDADAPGMMSYTGFDDPLKLLLQQERQFSISDTLNTLNEIGKNDKLLRAALHAANGLEYKDIAAKEGIPLGTVRSRIHKARHKYSESALPVLENV